MVRKPAKLRDPFEEVRDFRVLDERGYRELTGRAPKNGNIIQFLPSSTGFKVVTYNPTISTSVPYRTYSFVSSPKATEAIFDYAGVRNGEFNGDEWGEFLTILRTGRGNLRLKNRNASSLILEAIAETFQYVPHGDYTSPGFEARLMNGMQDKLKGLQFDFDFFSAFRDVGRKRKVKIDDAETLERVSKRKTRVLTPEEERTMFGIYNGAKYLLAQEIGNMARGRYDLVKMHNLTKIIDNARNSLVSVNLRLVIAMAKRNPPRGVDFYDAISAGNEAVLRTVEKFDISRGWKFSTYCCMAIQKSFSRIRTTTRNYRNKFPFEFDPEKEMGHPIDDKREEKEDFYVEHLTQIMNTNAARLNKNELIILGGRFPLDGSEGKTLEGVGNLIGITKERVRQLQNRALKKVKNALMKKAGEN